MVALGVMYFHVKGGHIRLKRLVLKQSLVGQGLKYKIELDIYLILRSLVSRSVPLFWFNPFVFSPIFKNGGF